MRSSSIFFVQKHLNDFRFHEQPSPCQRIVDEGATGRFLHEGRNVVLLGTPSVSKTFSAITPGMLTVHIGHRIYFTTATDLARHMSPRCSSWLATSKFA
jgi:DNA replication protein DnaC